jgi:hypothetical protein
VVPGDGSWWWATSVKGQGTTVWRAVIRGLPPDTQVRVRARAVYEMTQLRKRAHAGSYELRSVAPGPFE